jgi:hypothetical protein
MPLKIPYKVPLLPRYSSYLNKLFIILAIDIESIFYRKNSYNTIYLRYFLKSRSSFTF